MNAPNLQQRRKALMEELEDLVCVRRGSVVEQFVPATAADGRQYRRGPYPVYTFKEQGRTISKRLREPRQVDLYRQQIRDGKRFQEVVCELMRVGEALSDAAAQSDTVKKTPHTKLKRTRKSSAG
jgi:hypothetical protein